MRYLKKYKIFESNNDILDDLNYLTLDLKDIGLNVSIKDESPVNFNIHDITILIKKTEYGINSNNYFEFNSEVRETIIRIDQYMRQLGYKTQYVANFDNAFIVRPDEKLRYLNGLWVGDNDMVLSIKLSYIKKI
jgi:hypothetical protein